MVTVSLAAPGCVCHALNTSVPSVARLANASGKQLKLQERDLSGCLHGELKDQKCGICSVGPRNLLLVL